MAVGIGRLGDEVPDLAVRLVLALPLFVLHDAALLVELLLIDSAEQVAHPVALHPESQVERVGGDVLEVVGAILVGCAVEVRRPDAFEHLKVVVVEVFRTVEHEVLEEMRKARPSFRLILRADVIPDVDSHDGRFAILMHDEREAVVEYECLIGNVRQGVGKRSGFLCSRRQRQHESQRQGRSKVPHDSSRIVKRKEWPALQARAAKNRVTR